MDLSADIGTIQNLLERAFSDVDSSREFSLDVLEWKYRKASGEETCFIGAIGDKPVSFYGVLARRYISGNKVKTVGLVVDVLSVPELQGKGVFTATGKYALKHLKQTRVTSVIGFPIRPEVLPGHLKVGWEIKFKLPVYIYPIGRGEPNGLAESISRAVLFGCNFVLSALRVRSGTRAEMLNVDDFVDNSGVLSFYRKQNQDGSVILEKNSEFLTWRLNRPKVKYVCFILRDAEVVACAICRVMKIKNIRTLVIVDIDAQNDNYAKQLANSIIDYAIHEKVTLISFCTNKTNMRRLGLLRLGFIRSHLHFDVITRDIDDHAFGFTETKSRVTWLDSDTV